MSVVVVVYHSSVTFRHLLFGSSEQGGMWWSSWLTSAKEKSINALSATKRDLAEFVSVIGTDTKAVVEGASANINKIITQTESSSDSLETSDSETKKDSVARVVQPEAPYDRCQAELFSLQCSAETYLQDPSDKGTSVISALKGKSMYAHIDIASSGQ